MADIYYETPLLETERLILKRGTLEDYEKVYDYDFRKLRDIAGEFEFVKQNPSNIASFAVPTKETYDWIIYLKDGTPIVNVVADSEEKDLKAIELAFNTHPSYWRKGYTYEAVVAIMRFLFSVGYENILCGYDEGNIKSKALNEKLGFLPYRKEENSWYKNGIPITTYTSIMSKERFKEIYGQEYNFWYRRYYSWR